MATKSRTSAKKKTSVASKSKPSAKKAGASKSKAAPKGPPETGLTTSDLSAISALPQCANAPNHVRTDLVDAIANDQTLAAIEAYRSNLESFEIDVDVLLEDATEANRIRQLSDKARNTLAKTERNYQTVGEPLQNLASNIHKMLDAAPEGSKMRESFNAFLTGWKAAFPGRGHAAAGKKSSSKGDESGSGSKTPPSNNGTTPSGSNTPPSDGTDA
jgi:hypothetical protein